MKIQAFLNLVRWKNLAFLGYIQLLIYFVLFGGIANELSFSKRHFWMFEIALLCIAGAGYIINDIKDKDIDLLNKPAKRIIGRLLDEEIAKRWYVILNLIGIGLGIVISMSLGRPEHAFFFIGPSIVLNLYSKYLKAIPLIGNLSVSLLIALSVVLLTFIIPDDLTVVQANYNGYHVIYVLGIIAFFINLAREIIKDIEDIKGDYNFGMKTLPILLGIDRSKNIATVFVVIPLGIILSVVIITGRLFPWISAYLILFSIVPLSYVALKLYNYSTNSNYRRISKILKLSMFFGMNLLLFLY